jgi:hypothetical protein
MKFFITISHLGPNQKKNILKTTKNMIEKTVATDTSQLKEVKKNTEERYNTMISNFKITETSVVKAPGRQIITNHKNVD